MINFNPTFDSETALKTTAVNLAFRFGMQTAEHFEIKENEDWSFKDTKDLESRAWLTSLAIETDNKRFVFNEVVMSVQQERNIVTTPLQGRDGTIKEFISNGDYNITIDAGVMSGNSNNEIIDNEDGFFKPQNYYPEAELKRLGCILTEQKTLNVQSDFLEVFGIKSAVVKSFNLTQETHSNRQSIQITMLSDLPYEIKALGSKQ